MCIDAGPSECTDDITALTKDIESLWLAHWTRPRNSKVDQMYDREVFVDHDIVGLNVAMNDAMFMYVF